MKKLLLLVLAIVSTITFSGVVYYGSGEGTFLENKLGFSAHGQKIITGDSDDPTSVAKEASAGSIYMRTSGEVYKKTDNGSSTNWLPVLDSTLTLNDISDVDTTGVATGDFLYYDGSEWINQELDLSGYAELDSSPTFTGTVTGSGFIGDGSGLTGISTVGTLDDLTDVNLTTPATGEALVFDGTEWVNDTVASSLDSLSDVNLTAPATDNILSYDGSEWVNTPDSVYTKVDGSRNFTGDQTFDQDVTITGTLTLSNVYTVATQTNYLSVVGNEIVQAPIAASTTGDLTSSTLTVVGGTGAANSAVSVDVATSSYTVAGVVTAADYGEFDSKVSNRFGYRNAEDNSLDGWNLTNLDDVTFEIDTTNPINGLRHYKLTNHTDGLGEYVYNTAITVPEGFRGRMIALEFKYSYDGASTDIYVSLVDSTNAVVIDAFLLTAGTNQKGVLQGFTQSTTANVYMTTTIAVANNGKILKLDDLSFEVDYQKEVKLYETEVIELSGGNGHGSTDNKIRRFDTQVTNTALGIATVTTTAANGTIITVNRACNAVITYVDGSTNSGMYLGITKNDTALTTSIINLTDAFILAKGYSSSGLIEGNMAFTGKLAVGDVIRAHTSAPGGESTNLARFNFTCTAERDGVVHSNTLPENVYSASIAADAAVSLETDNFLTTCTDADPRVCTLVTGFFTAAPKCWANPTAGTAIVTASSTTEVTIDTTDDNTAFSLFCQRSGTDYKPLTGTIITPVSQTCFIKDTKTSGTAGGSSSANTVHTRVLNTTQGDCGFVTLASNQFTVPAGKYKIKGSAPAYVTNQNQAFIYSVTASAYVLDGQSNFAGDADEQGHALVEGILTVTVPTTYELRHWTSSANADDGLGFQADVNASNPQTAEVYSIVELEKIK